MSSAPRGRVVNGKPRNEVIDATAHGVKRDALHYRPGLAIGGGIHQHQVDTTSLIKLGIDAPLRRSWLYLLKAARIFGNRHLSWKSLHAGCAEESDNSPGTRQHIDGVLRFRNWATMT